MTPRGLLLLLSVVPLIAVEPGLSSAAGQSLPFGDPQIDQQLRQAEDLARQAGERFWRSLEALGRDLPRYGLPYVDDAGNIVIPRRGGAAVPRGTPIPAPVPSSA
jgi:hypothetical protein